MPLNPLTQARWGRALLPALLLAGQVAVIAWLLGRGGWLTVASVVLVMLGADLLARQRQSPIPYRVAQSLAVIAAAVRIIRWIATRVGPWTGSPASAWALERSVTPDIFGALSILVLIVALAKPHTVAGEALRHWFAWMLHKPARADYIGPVTLGKTVAPLGFGTPVRWGGADRYRHMVLVGPPGTGKTARVLSQIAYQDMLRMARGERMSLTVIEPKGEFAGRVAATARSLGLKVIHVDPFVDGAAHWNPLEGPAEAVAEGVRAVLSTLFGKQDQFFASMQEQATKNSILMLKALHGDDLTFIDVQRHLLDLDLMRRTMREYERLPSVDPVVLEYFRGEITKNDKWAQHISGLKAQLQDLLTNHAVRDVLCNKSTVNLDEYLSEGGQVLCVGTALGSLTGKLGSLFGKLLVMSLQNAVFRREGLESTRIPHVMVIDEAPMYINPEFSQLLSIGRSYRTSVVLALQNLAQMDLWSQGSGGKAFADTILSNCSARMILGTGASVDDAQWYAQQFGTELVPEHTQHKDSTGRSSEGVRTVEKLRVRPTEIMEQKPGHALVLLTQDGTIRHFPNVRTSFVRWPRTRKASTPAQAAPSTDNTTPAVPEMLVAETAFVAPDATGDTAAPDATADSPDKHVEEVRPGLLVDVETGEIMVPAAVTASHNPAPQSAIPGDADRVPEVEF